MSWNSFLTASLRINDLHNKNVTPSKKEKTAQSPDRPVYENAYWLDLGVSLLEFLREQETNNNDMILVSDFHDHIRDLKPSVTIEDIRYVISVLSSSRALGLLDSKLQLCTEENTALLYRPPNSLAIVGLSDTGRKAIGFSKVAVDNRYTDHAADRIHRLIEDREFQEAVTTCKGLSNSIREIGQIITSILEQSCSSDLRDGFIKNGDRFNESLKATGEIIRNAFLTLDTIISDDELYLEYEEEINEIEKALKVLDETTERTRRRFLNLLKRINTEDFSYKGHYRFDLLISHLLADCSFSPTILDKATELLCPAIRQVPVVDPVHLLSSVQVKSQSAISENLVIKISDDEPEVPDWLIGLLNKHQEFLRSQLKNGPVPLSEILNGEDLSPQNMVEAMALIGATMNINESIKGVSFKLMNDRQHYENDTFTMIYDDIALTEIADDT